MAHEQASFDEAGSRVLKCFTSTVPFGNDQSPSAPICDLSSWSGRPIQRCLVRAVQCSNGASGAYGMRPIAGCFEIRHAHATCIEQVRGYRVIDRAAAGHDLIDPPAIVVRDVEVPPFGSSANETMLNPVDPMRSRRS